MSRPVVVSLLTLSALAVTLPVHAQGAAQGAAPVAFPGEPTTATPAATPTPTPPPTSTLPAEEDSKDAEHGLVSPKVRLGAGIGGGLSTRPITINLMARINRTWGVGAEYKFLPSLTFNDSSLSAYAVGADLRYFPWHGSFFLGLALGYQSLKGSTTTFAEQLSGLYVTPRVGWLWAWDFGLTMGLDVGVTVPVTASTSGLGDGDKLDSAMKTFGKLPLPDIELFRLGVLL